MLFENPCDKEAFSHKMKQLSNVMRKTHKEIDLLKRQIAVNDMTID